MSMEDTDNTKNTKYRFCDGSGEPLSLLTPIEGFNEKPLVTLETAIEPLISIVPDIVDQVSKAKKHVTNPADNLSIDQSAAIILYTMEWHPCTYSVYYILNSTLRAEDRNNLKPWFLYLKLILTALSRLPLIKLTVYRGIILPNHEKYQYGKEIIWWGFSSCSANRNIAEEEHFLGPNGQRTLFIIDCVRGIDISKHSYFRKEKEVLLLPATPLKLIQCNYEENNLYVIHLIEIQSSCSILQPVSSNQIIINSSGLNDIQSPPAPKTTFNMKLNRKIARLKNRSHACVFQKRFTDDDIETIVQQVIMTKQCRVLFLRGNEMTSQGVFILAKSLYNNYSLEELYLTDIRFGDIGAGTIAKSLSNKTNLILKRLCFNHNGITDEGAEHLAIMLATNQSLTHLWLPKNQISDRGIQCMAKVLININTALQLLSLEWNKFKDDATVDILVEMLSKNQTLGRLDIDGGDLSRLNIKKLKIMAETKKGFKLIVH